MAIDWASPPLWYATPKTAYLAEKSCGEGQKPKTYLKKHHFRQLRRPPLHEPFDLGVFDRNHSIRSDLFCDPQTIKQLTLRKTHPVGCNNPKYCITSRYLIFFQSLPSRAGFFCEVSSFRGLYRSSTKFPIRWCNQQAPKSNRGRVTTPYFPKCTRITLTLIIGSYACVSNKPKAA